MHDDFLSIKKIVRASQTLSFPASLWARSNSLQNSLRCALRVELTALVERDGPFLRPIATSSRPSLRSFTGEGAGVMAMAPFSPAHLKRHSWLDAGLPTNFP